jgi:prepilin-type N-terminal cleavage/methylation domain-containing protein/prepilin-type processing-associated H-X9-DG protein
MNPENSKTHFTTATVRAFTLIELLVVIAIIAILASLIMPAISGVRQKANQTKCVHNLMQWALAIPQYVQDHNGSVQAKDWANVAKAYYEPYFGQTKGKVTVIQGHANNLQYNTALWRMCPSQVWDGTSNTPVGYVFVAQNPNPNGAAPDSYNIRAASHLTNLLTMIESIPDANGATITGSSTDASALNTYTKPECQTASLMRHNGVANALFGDGHVESLQWTDMDPASPKPDIVAKVKQWFTLN